MTCGQQKNIRKIKDLPSYKKIFEVVNNNLQILGVLPDQSIKLRYFVLLGSLTLMIISELTYFVNMISPENFRDLLDLAPCITSGLNAILKVLCLAVNKKKLFDLIDRLEPIFEDFSKSSQKTIVAKNILRITSVTRFYHYFCMILVTIFSFWIVGAILIHYWQTNEWIFLLPYAVLLPFSVDTWLSWLFVFLFSVINGYICVIGYVTVDCFYIILTSQVCNHFAILSDEILHLDKNNTKKLRHIVIKHQYIFQLSGMLEEIFKASNLFSILMAILEICALEFNIATGDRSQVPAYFMFLSSVICQILMMSIFGENLIRESRKVGESAYLCIWYNMDIKSRKMMLIIMTRASKPAQLTAYNFSIICHETFTSGHINLGSGGYRVSRSGTIQVSLFNPHGTLVKMFVVLYDLTSMPASARTFLRQRTLYMPAGADPPPPAHLHKYMRYLIHLRFMTSKSGKLYLHTDIRIIVSRKSDLDTATAHSAIFLPNPTNQVESNHNDSDSNHNDSVGNHNDSVGNHKESVSNHNGSVGNHNGTVGNHNGSVSNYNDSVGNHNGTTNNQKPLSRSPNRVFGGCSEFDSELQNDLKQIGFDTKNGAVSYELRSFTYAPDNPKYSPR